MPVFEYTFTVDAPLKAVHDFHHDTRALKLLTPPPTIVQFGEIEPLAEGSVSRFTLWIGPLPLRWMAVHRDVSASGFTDVQVEGPARKWEHTHTFLRETENRTRIQEHIEYEHKQGLNGLLSRALFNRLGLYFTFTYRKFATRRFLKKHTSAEESRSPE